MNLKTFSYISISIGVMVGTSGAQLLDKDETPNQPKTTFQTQVQSKLSRQNLSSENLREQMIKLPILDGPVDPKEYIVGPGDVYSVNIWMSPPLNALLAVTPEGTIIVPTVGEILVAGLHLDEAKKKVVADIRKRYISSEVSITLITPRILSVAVKGIVNREGSLYLQATERVEAAIVLANMIDKVNQGISADDREKLTTSDINAIPRRDSVGSRRKIVVRHRDGSATQADLEKFFVRRDPKLNPYLADGDVIIVPKKDLEKDFIGVYGGVNKEGVFEFVPGDSLLTMLGIARGLTSMADSEHIQLIRSDDLGGIAQPTVVNIAAIASRKSDDVRLERGDRIIVPEKVELRRDYKVYVEGEVLHPGFYPTTRDSTRLSEVIRRSGGFTQNASLSASQIFRTSIQGRDRIAANFENSRGISMQEDTTYFKIENGIRLNREQVVVDFVGLFDGNDRSKDLQLHDGDHVIVAAKTKTVYVFGEVVRPGHVVFAANQRYTYYLEKAGGIADDGASGDTRILKAGSKQWLFPSETTIEEGDYVWVPKTPYRPVSYYLLNYSQLFSIVGTIGTLVLVLIQLNK